MKYEIKEINITFDDLKTGDAFQFDNLYYIKITNTNSLRSCLCLDTCALVDFTRNVNIRRLSGVVITTND